MIMGLRERQGLITRALNHEVSASGLGLLGLQIIERGYIRRGEGGEEQPEQLSLEVWHQGRFLGYVTATDVPVNKRIVIRFYGQDAEQWYKRGVVEVGYRGRDVVPKVKEKPAPVMNLVALGPRMTDWIEGSNFWSMLEKEHGPLELAAALRTPLHGEEPERAAFDIYKKGGEEPVADVLAVNNPEMRRVEFSIREDSSDHGVTGTFNVPYQVLRGVGRRA